MSRINRRALLLSSGSAVIASMGAATAYATEPRRRDREPSRDLRALIKAHKATYAAFGKAIQANTTEPAGPRKGHCWLSAPILRSGKVIAGPRPDIF
jgi:hypothetical protein